MRVLALPSLALLALATGSSLASAQVVFTGVIEKATLPSFCQEETHYLTCTGPTPDFPSGVLLKSTVLDLDAYIGINTRFTALPRGVECPIYDVQAAGPPTATLDWCGSPVPGCPARFRVGPSGVIGEWWLYLAFAPDFLPVDPVAGTILVAQPVTLLGQGPTFGGGAVLDTAIPPIVALTGLDVWFQGLRRDVGPIGPIELTNAVCFTILGPSPPCIVPGC